jgi:hypothetical protein
MQVAHVQLPLALVTALCIAAVPLAHPATAFAASTGSGSTTGGGSCLGPGVSEGQAKAAAALAITDAQVAQAMQAAVNKASDAYLANDSSADLDTLQTTGNAGNANNTAQANAAIAQAELSAALGGNPTLAASIVAEDANGGPVGELGAIREAAAAGAQAAAQAPKPPAPPVVTTLAGFNQAAAAGAKVIVVTDVESNDLPQVLAQLARDQAIGEAAFLAGVQTCLRPPR